MGHTPWTVAMRARPEVTAGRSVKRRRRSAARGKRAVVAAWMGWILLGCTPPQLSAEADLSWPTLVAVSLPERQEVSPTPEIWFTFSEPLDPATATNDAVVVIPFDLGEPCGASLDCGDSARCRGGRCQRNPVDGPFRADMARTPLGLARRSRLAPTRLAFQADGRRLSLRVVQPLQPHRLHVLLVGATLTDLSGNPLRTPLGADLAFEHVFATGGAELGRPQVALISPRAGRVGLPVNLERLVVSLSKPVNGLSHQALWLQSESGRRVDLSPSAMAGPCGAQHEGHCLWLVPRGGLVGPESWRLHVDRGVRDAAGQAVFNEAPPVIVTGGATDRDPPRLLSRDVRVADGCAVLALRLDEDADIRVRASWSAEERVSVGRGDHEVGIPVTGPLSGSITVWASDLAGNEAEPLVVAVESHAARSVIISEVLANPAGPEPSQEFVELFNSSRVPVDLTGWSLDDGDDGKGAALLPRGTLAPGAFAVVVGAAHSSALVDDPAPEPDALVIRLSSTVGGRGLSNRGESLALRDAEGRMISWYTAYWRTDGRADDGRSIERSRPDACGLRGDWSPNPQGSSTPGSAGLVSR